MDKERKAQLAAQERVEILKRLAEHYTSIGKTEALDDLYSKEPSLKPKQVTPVKEDNSKNKLRGK